MKRTVVLCLAVLAVSMATPGDGSATEYRIRHVGAVCITRDALERYMAAVLHARETRDVSWMKHLYDSEQCVRVKKGLKVTVKNAGLTVSQVYVHAKEGGGPLVGWTVNEMFRGNARSDTKIPLFLLIAMAVVGAVAFCRLVDPARGTSAPVSGHRRGITPRYPRDRTSR